jgi:hypothetical protein
MTIETARLILQASPGAIAKWERGTEQTKETYRAWWDDEGTKFCKYCFTFGCLLISHPPIINLCPLNDDEDGCASEFCTADTAWEQFDFPAFHLATVAMLDRLKRLDEEARNILSTNEVPE